MALVLELREVINMFAGTLIGIVLGIIVGGTVESERKIITLWWREQLD